MIFFKKILSFIFRSYIEVLSILPTDIGVKIRYWAYKPLFNKVLGKFYISRNVKIEGFSNITLGKNVELSYGSGLFANNANINLGDRFFLGINASIEASRENIEIGDSCMIAANCVLVSDDHKFSDTQVCIMDQGFKSAEIIIGNDVWIGSNCVILKGVEIGKGSVVGAGSVVSKIIPPYSVFAGNPGKVIANRKKREMYKKISG